MLQFSSSFTVYGPPPSADAGEVVLHATHVEERVNVVEPCPSLSLLVANGVSNFVLLPPQPNQMVVPARLTWTHIYHHFLLNVVAHSKLCRQTRKTEHSNASLDYVKP